MTRLAGVIGFPLSHTRSPALHNAAYAAAKLDAFYVALPTPTERLKDVLQAAQTLGFLGLNVTVPHKRAAMALCDHIDPLAAQVGAVNTLVFSANDEISGHNTDVSGFLTALDDAHIAVGPSVVLGSGGAAAAVATALESRGARVVIVSRKKNNWTPETLARELPGTALLVDATSAGLDAKTEAQLPAPILLSRLPKHAVVCSLIYHRETALLIEARGLGLATLDGKGMLIHQAAAAFSLMTGVPAPLAAMRTVRF